MSKQQRAQQARYLRKVEEKGGEDEEEAAEELKFKENLEQAVNAYSQKATTNNLEKQIEYFGYAIEPFNMKREEQMGELDDDGFFVFNKRTTKNDAWLESLNQDQNREQFVDKIKKKIKTEGREQNVYQANDEPEKGNSSEQNQEEQDVQNKEDEVGDGEKLTVEQIKILIGDELPFNSNVNKYMKQLKKQKKLAEYEKLLYLCNQYISLTGEHDIFSMKKEDIEASEDSQQQPPNQKHPHQPPNHPQQQEINLKPDHITHKPEEPEFVDWNENSAEKDGPDKAFDEKAIEQDQDDIF